MDTGTLLEIPPFLRRAPSLKKVNGAKRRHRGSFLTIPKPKTVPKATKAHVKEMVTLGWNRSTAKQKSREDAADIVRFQVRPTPQPAHLRKEVI